MRPHDSMSGTLTVEPSARRVTICFAQGYQHPCPVVVRVHHDTKVVAGLRLQNPLSYKYHWSVLWGDISVTISEGRSSRDKGIWAKSFTLPAPGNRPKSAFESDMAMYALLHKRENSTRATCLRILYTCSYFLWLPALPPTVAPYISDIVHRLPPSASTSFRTGQGKV